tara:strand:+ start:533 stop:949 length:417 start_codon:yes stop_codon:yes gene_type:complete
MNYTLAISSIVAILIVVVIGYGLNEGELVIEDEVNYVNETRWFSHQFNNVSGMSVANETFYNGSCNIFLDITVRFDTEFGNFTLFVDDEEVLYISRNKTNIEVMGDNLTITVHASGGDEYPDNAMADYYVVKMTSNCY